MSKRLLIRLGLVIGAVTIATGAVAFWISRRPVAFDEAFRQCGEDDAEWRLVVKYSVDGLTDDEKYTTYFRRREPTKTRIISGSWLRWWEPTVIEWEEVGGPGILMECGHACGIGNDGNWFCDYSMKSANQTAAGVDLSVEHGRSGDAASVVAETISLTFPEAIADRKGKISYSASWQALR